MSNEKYVKLSKEEGLLQLNKLMNLFFQAKEVDCYDLFGLNNEDVTCFSFSVQVNFDLKGNSNHDCKEYTMDIDKFIKSKTLFEKIILFYENKIDLDCFEYNNEYFIEIEPYDRKNPTKSNERKITEKQFNLIKKFKLNQKIESNLEVKNTKEKIVKI